MPGGTEKLMNSYIKKSFRPFWWALDKINKKAYIKLFPKYLRWLGINIDEKAATGTWISPLTFFDSSHYDYIKIGRQVTISFGVVMLVHDYSIVHAARSIGGEVKEILYKRVDIGNNVFIGANTVILPGTIIGDNCIVGGGTVLRGICLANSVYVGNPCKRICSIEEYLKKHEALLKESKKC